MAHSPAPCTAFHYHDSDEVLIFLQGKGVIRTRSDEFPFEAPCSVIIPAFTLRRVCNTTEKDTQGFGIIATGSRIFDETGQPSAWRAQYLRGIPPAQQELL